MRTAVLALDNGERVALGERIGRGGEGEVHAVSGDPAHAVKLYTLPDLVDRRDKVRAMVRDNLAAKSELVAFPVAVVNSGGRFAGFTMRKVTGRKPLHELYSPGARKAAFPQADYRFLVRTATNIARGVGAVHETGCVIGDINHSGILVSDAATIALIDADSFQYVEGGRRHACLVGVPEYTPPELQGMSLRTVERRVEHDRFGLAVVIFQLLFMGRHPFSGAYSGAGDMPIERAISESRFAYSRTRQVGMKPPPAVPTLADLPLLVAAAFEAAFAPGSTRPDARQWTALLGAMEHELRTCSKSAVHHYSPDANECPWCRMEAKQAIILFLPFAPHGTPETPSDPGAAGFDINATWAAIQAVVRPASNVPEPQLPALSLVPSEAATASRRARKRRRLFGVGWLLAAIAAFIVARELWLIWATCGGIGLARLFGEGKLKKAMRKEKTDLDNRFEAALSEWRKRVSAEPFQRLVDDLTEARSSYGRLGEVERLKVAEYQSNRRQEQLRAFLDSFLIRNQKIKGIGPGRVATLVAYGIETALDVSQGAVLNVPGFGSKTAASLIVWRQELEARFVYNTRPNTLDTVRLAAIKAETAQRAVELRRKLLAGPMSLLRARAEIETKRKALDPQLADVHIRRRQMEVDLAA